MRRPSDGLPALEASGAPARSAAHAHATSNHIDSVTHATAAALGGGDPKTFMR